jgi:carboxypeptidase T
MANPDGVKANTRKNRAPNYGSFGLNNEITSYGVDLNRNYGYKWYLYYLFPTQYHLIHNLHDSSYNYRGEHPFSENETQAVKTFVGKNDISISLSYHSYGEFIFYPWTHTSKDSPHESLFLSIGENISQINGYYLFTGRDYIIPRPGGTLGTSENWLYGERGILSFTVELCKRRAPSNPETVHKVCLTHVGVNLYVCERAWTIEQEKGELSTKNSVSAYSLFSLFNL